MLTIARAGNAGPQGAGDILPPVYPGLDFRRGQVTLVASAPGVGKSAWALQLALGVGQPALYTSPDCGPPEMKLRAAAMITRETVDSIEAHYRRGGAHYYDAELAKTTPLVRFGFDPSPDLESLDRELEAFTLVYGDYPHLWVVDNLANVWSGDAGEPYQALEKVLDFLHIKARETAAAVVVLHHLTGSYDDGNMPAPLSGLRGKVSKLPEMILTLFRATGTFPPQLGVAIVKNRSGKSDATGGHIVHLPLDLERMQVG